MAKPKIKILIIYKALWGTKRLRQSVLDHLTMFEDSALSCDTLYWNISDGSPRNLRLIECDFIVLHTTFLSTRYGDPGLFNYWLKKFNWLTTSSIPKVLFPQDERYYCLTLQNWINSLGGHVHLYSIFQSSPEKFSKIYPALNKKVTSFPCYTGYVSAEASHSEPKPWKERKVDILYRAKKLPLWVGRYGQIKRKIGDALKYYNNQNSLVIDSSTDISDTYLGKKWRDALNNSKFILGCEAGGSAIDKNGEITQFIKSHHLNTGDLPTFAEIDNAINYEWDNHNLLTIGPRNFEAIASKTCQILVEGDYGNLLVASKHYIPIKKDLSNLSEVLNNLNSGAGERIANKAYKDFIEGNEYTYGKFAISILTQFPEKKECVLKKSSRTLWVYFKILNRVYDLFPLISSPNLFKLWLISKLNKNMKL